MNRLKKSEKEDQIKRVREYWKNKNNGLIVNSKYIPKVGDIFKVVGRFEIYTCLCIKNGIFASYDKVGRVCFDPGANFQHLSELSEEEIKELNKS